MVNPGRFDRQSFLGVRGQSRLEDAWFGISGLGGGGSHIVQQLAHVGGKNYVLYDDDWVEESNLNRLVGATSVDARRLSPKLNVARRVILDLVPDAKIIGVPKRWQKEPEHLRKCQVVFGCVDSYQGRHELEVASRRYMFNYIDIGMDVHGDSPPIIGGQVVLSTPGGPCMRCLGFLSDELLSREAARYGDAGARPQVIWPNGVLASTAIGLAIELVTNWNGQARSFEYLRYSGNSGLISRDLLVRQMGDKACAHFSAMNVGDPIMRRL